MPLCNKGDDPTAKLNRMWLTHVDPPIFGKDRESQFKQFGNPESRQAASRLSYDYPSFHVRMEAPSGTSYLPDGGGGRIVNGLV